MIEFDKLVLRLDILDALYLLIVVCISQKYLLYFTKKNYSLISKFVSKYRLCIMSHFNRIRIQHDKSLCRIIGNDLK